VDDERRDGQAALNEARQKKLAARGGFHERFRLVIDD